jgi:hypothetical protein
MPLFLILILSWRDAVNPPLSFSSQVLAVHHWAVSLFGIIDMVLFGPNMKCFQVCDIGTDSSRVMDGGSVRTPHWGCYSYVCLYCRATCKMSCTLLYSILINLYIPAAPSKLLRISLAVKVCSERKPESM